MARVNPENSPDYLSNIYSQIFEERLRQQAALDKIFDDILVRQGGWDKFLLYTQPGNLKVWAYRNTDAELDHIGIGAIHGGSEEIGYVAWADYASKLIEIDRRFLLIPCANKWGHAHLERYSPNGQSVGDAGEFFGASLTCPTPESEHLLRFFAAQKIKPELPLARVTDRTRVLDIHEDTSWDDSLEGLIGPARLRALVQIYRGYAYHNGKTRNSPDANYTYLYFNSRGSEDHPLVHRVTATVRANGNHLPRYASTRFSGETVSEGVVWNSQDLSLGHALAFMGASVITAETLRRTPLDPTLQFRRHQQRLIIDTFLGLR
ncbi:hypothetical protein M1116_02055 [Patescibacteria group bacterium]|nr:hypothetical protein [Patescibacteria group bacterium]